MQKQLNYYYWANHRWIDFIYGHTWQDDYLPRLINHIVKGERAWLQRIEGIDWDRDLWHVESEEQLRKLSETNRTITFNLLKGNLAQRIPIERLNGQKYNPAIIDILQHIVSHGDHHRGQMAHYASSLRLTPPLTDYMTYCIENGQ